MPVKNLSVFFPPGPNHVNGPWPTCEDAAQDAIDNGPPAPYTYIARQNDPTAACAESASE